MNTARKQTSQARAFTLALATTAATGVLAASVFAAAKGPLAGKADGKFIQQRIEEGFKTLDANRDGALSKVEFARIIEVSPRMKANPDSVEQVFGRLDADTNEKLSFEEYKGIVLIQAAAALAQKNGAAPAAPAPKATKPAVTVTTTGKPLTQDELAFFEKKIRPVLADKCYKCHSAEADKVKGGLLVDSRDGIRTSGDNGHAVVPGDVESSLLIKALRYEDSDLQMPPKKDGGKLPDNVIADFEQWIKMGAPDPRDGKSTVTAAVNIEKGREHWAFKLPQRAPAPTVKDSSWIRNEIDRHILAGLEGKGLKPVGDADKATLLRRVFFDLIGLPPTPEQLNAFLADKDPKAFEKVVDRLLASPQFGERWGRHWLDVARYAESSGKELNVAYPHAWRYRDWVIQAFNEDKPYDRFLKEQIAGDLMPAKDETRKANQLIATGYLAVGAKSHNTRDYRQFQLDTADEQIDVVGQGILGLTIACARCHDHKFDPVPQMDYYAMAGIFLSTETRFGTPRFIQNNQSSPLINLPEGAHVTEAKPLTQAERDNLKRAVEASKTDRDEVLAEARASGDRAAVANPRVIRSGIVIAIGEKLLGRYDEEGQQKQYAMGVADKMYPRDTQLLQRGELDKPQDTIPRGFVQVLSTKPAAAQPKINKGSGRLELADWIASPENPLTARVMVNRVWVNLFDHGIVPTPDNFGTTGQKPANQGLLDHLAISFVESGWSMKKLIKRVVMSHTYQLASEYSEANYAADPDNTLVWRQNKRRLDAEAIRDAMLAVAGRLDLTPVKGSPVANVEGNVQFAQAGLLFRPGGPGGPGRPGMRRGPGMGPGMGAPAAPEQTYRSVYLPIVRDQVPESLAVFDFAESSLVIGDREVTTVPSQALYLMNSATVQRVAEAMAARLVQSKATGAGLARTAFELAYSRPPTANELKSTEHFFKQFNAAEASKYESKDKLGFAGLTAFCQALIGSAEFRYLN